MFERYIGADQFRNGIRNYLKAHARGNATSADLIASLAAQSDDPAGVSKAFFSFIDQPGVPFVKVALDCGGKAADARAAAAALPAARFDRPAPTQTWGIPMTVRYADGGTVREQKALVASGQQARLELTDAQQLPDLGDAQCARYRAITASRWSRSCSSRCRVRSRSSTNASSASTPTRSPPPTAPAR